MGDNIVLSSPCENDGGGDGDEEEDEIRDNDHDEDDDHSRTHLTRVLMRVMGCTLVFISRDI